MLWGTFGVTWCSVAIYNEVVDDGVADAIEARIASVLFLLLEIVDAAEATSAPSLLIGDISPIVRDL